MNAETNFNAWKHATAAAVKRIHERRARHAAGDHSLCLLRCCDVMPRQTTVLSLHAQAEMDAARKIVAHVLPDTERIERAYRRDLAAMLAQAQKPSVGIEYHSGKRTPYRAYVERNGSKRYLGYYADERTAWQRANAAAQAVTA